MNFETNTIEKKIGYTFRNKSLLKQAFTRQSYYEENPSAEHNELLEFIGDSVLGLIAVKQMVTRYAYPIADEAQYEREAPVWRAAGHEPPERYFRCEMDESEFTEMKIHLVRSETLSDATTRAGLQKYLLMSHGDVQQGVGEEQSVKEALFEAILGAVALDCGWEMSVLEDVAERLLQLTDRMERFVCGDEDPIESLQDWMQAQIPFAASAPLNEEMPFGVKITVGTETVYGYGKTEEGAKAMAARRALTLLRKEKDRAERILAAVGEPLLPLAINQLQELWQKEIISEPHYTVEEHPDGWLCMCELKEIGGGIGVTATSKKDAKREAAYLVLCELLERRPLSLYERCIGSVGEDAPMASALFASNEEKETEE